MKVVPNSQKQGNKVGTQAKKEEQGYKDGTPSKKDDLIIISQGNPSWKVEIILLLTLIDKNSQ